MRKYIILILLLAFAASIRLYQSGLPISEVDYPGHIVASMRLFSSSLISLRPSSNLIIQLFSFRHGYTTQLFPAVFYSIFHLLLKFPITESTLAITNISIGIISLLVIFFFIYTLWDKKTALIALTLFSILPIHVSLSRVHVGTQLIQGIFFFLSITFIYRYIQKQNQFDKNLYYVTTFFLIGSDNIFPVSLALHILLLWYLSNNSRQMMGNYIKVLYLNLQSFVCIAAPILLYICFDVIRLVKYGSEAPGGFLFRTLGKTSHLYFDLIRPLNWSMQLIGIPLVVTFIYFMFKSLISKKGNWESSYMYLIIVIYYLLLTYGKEVERSYIYFIAVPLVAIVARKINTQGLIFPVVVISTFIYMVSVIFNVPIINPTIKAYGSTQWRSEAPDNGLKTLGYIVRKHIVAANSTSYGKLVKLNIILDAPGGWYYLGDYFFDIPSHDLNGSTKLINTLYIVRQDMNREENTILKNYVVVNKLRKIAVITKNKTEILTLYSHLATDKIKEFPISQYNSLYDNEFGNLKSLGKLYLGIY